MSTSERTYTTIDKSAWGEGLWQSEPDKIQWVDEATGLDCLIVRQPRHGNLCGYVGVGPGHPLHGRDYGGLDDIDVHGGLTFADRCMEGLPESEGVCHVPGPGRPVNVWWLGFDCAHAGDRMPGMEALLRSLPPVPGLSELPAEIREWANRLNTYKTVGYVRAECASLARQLAEYDRDAP